MMMFPFLFLAFAGLGRGGVPLLFLGLLSSCLVFPVAFLPLPLYFNGVRQAAAVSRGHRFVLARAVRELQAFLDEERATCQRQLGRGIILRHCYPPGAERKLHRPDHLVGAQLNWGGAQSLRHISYFWPHGV